ncbi:ABC transporter ATP-binding protein [Rubrivivax albus]|uniref:ABC transporter ATP-binding protein n=1 Tax=Rubrivivax albus TaxID=2499835 RepID=A0A3S2WVN4_9BURK|nr:ABC transporter ATP-binding protein [Rubrivivax albus]
MLEVKDLAVTYGQHRALKGVSLTVAPGEIVVILGANGAGKTSLLKAIAGLERGAGSVRLDGTSIAGLPPHRIVEAGLALVPEGRGIFGDLTVQENLALGAFAHRARDGQQTNLDRVLGLFTRLSERSGQVARTMSGGEQQMVAIGRALMSAPTILMLDEPSLGLSPLLCTELFRNLRTIRDSGVGVLLVEQNARQSLAIADRAYLLENGEIVGQGPAAQLARDPAVQAAYLGGAAGHAAAPAPAATPSAVPAAAIAAHALAAVTAPSTGGYGSPVVSTSADQLVPTRIADLVRIASQRQAEDVTTQRQAPRDDALAARARAELKTSGTLDEAVARITQAAQRSAPAPVPASASAPRSASTPAIEVWHRPGIEVWERQPDGTLKRKT